MASQAPQESPRRARAAGSRGFVIALVGLKPGVGASGIAVNLAVGLRRLTRRRLILLDAHFDLGTQEHHLGLQPERHLDHALESTLADALLRHRSGIEVLLRSPNFTLPSAAQLHDLFAQARRLARYTVVDVPARPDATHQVLLTHADLILVVATPEDTALRHAEWRLAQVEAWGHRRKVRVVMNRWQQDGGFDSATLRGLFGVEILALLPLDAHLVVHAGNRGEPYVSQADRANLARDMLSLTRRVHHVLVPHVDL